MQAVAEQTVEQEAPFVQDHRTFPLDLPSRQHLRHRRHRRRRRHRHLKLINFMVCVLWYWFS